MDRMTTSSAKVAKCIKAEYMVKNGELKVLVLFCEQKALTKWRMLYRDQEGIKKRRKKGIGGPFYS